MNTEKADAGRIRTAIMSSVETVQSLLGAVDDISEIASVIIESLRKGGKVMTAGNGGSAAEALHMSEELVGRFRGDRKSLPSNALVADPTCLTCIGNDFGFDHIFSRQVDGLGCSGDVLVLFSTSGNAVNLRLALEAAKRVGVVTVCLLGRNGGPLAGQGDYELIVSGSATERIQEAHQVILHLILDAVEVAFSPAERKEG